MQTLAESWREHFPNSFYDASFALIPKSGKGIIREKNYRVISFINTDVKILKSWPGGSVGWSTVLYTKRLLV